jgi:hypothetical protein
MTSPDQYLDDVSDEFKQTGESDSETKEFLGQLSDEYAEVDAALIDGRTDLVTTKEAAFIARGVLKQVAKGDFHLSKPQPKDAIAIDVEHPSGVRVVMNFMKDMDYKVHGEFDSENEYVELWVPAAAPVKKPYSSDIFKSIDRIEVINMLVHELTHAMDYDNFPGAYEAPYVEPDESYTGYANHPLETNAHFRETTRPLVEKFYNDLRSIKQEGKHQRAVSRLLHMLTMSSHEFISEWEKGLRNHKWFNALSESSKKSIYGRIVVLHDQMRDQSRQVLNKLRDMKDPVTLALYA